jgi:hypothetical protein
VDIFSGIFVKFGCELLVFQWNFVKSGKKAWIKRKSSPMLALGWSRAGFLLVLGWR